MNIFTISDTHFNQSAIIKFGQRPFKCVKEMNDTLIDNWNSKIEEGDLVVIVGDFIFEGIYQVEDILKRLKGRKILIKGNHDTNSRIKKIKSVTDSVYICKKLIINRNGKRILFSHKPTKRAVNKFDINIHGHHHRKLRGANLPEFRYYNAAVEFNNFTPINIEDVLNLKGI